MIGAAFELLFSLNSSGIYHMDLWAANVMMCNEGIAPTCAIALENCFSATPPFLSETPGFQFGFFYRREVYRCIDEKRYDAVVRQALNAYQDVDHHRFNAVYEQVKHRDIGRKERRDVFSHGRIGRS